MDPTERSAPRDFWEETFVTAQALFPTVLVAIGRLFHGQKALVNLLAKRNQLRVSTLALGCYLIEFVHLAYASFRMLGISC